MPPLRFLSLLVLLLAAQAWSLPAKSSVEGGAGEEYSEDDPEPEYTEDAEGETDDDDPVAVEEPPQFLSRGISVHVRTGETISLPCLVKNGESTVITWMKDNSLLYSDSSPLTEDKKRIVRLPNNTLLIYNATVKDSSDDYKCTILTQTPMMINHRVLVDPERAPVSPPTQPQKSLIRVTPRKRVEVNAGESVTIGCETRIQPPPKIKWFHENERISSDRSAVTVNGSRITLKNARRQDAGPYQCLVENGADKPPVEAINVIVNYPPEIEVKNDHVHTGLGVESDLTCIVHAHPHAKVRWFKSQMEIIPEKGRIEMKGNRTWHVLEILHTTQQDFGEYRCVATNRDGTNRAERTITLTGTPSRATIYSGKMTEADAGMELKWRLESYSPITEYKLEYHRLGDDAWEMVKPTVTNGRGNQFTVEHLIEGLEPGSYEAILSARNNFGWSLPSAPHKFAGDYSVGQPENVKGSSATALRPLGITVALFLVVSSCALKSL